MELSSRSQAWSTFGCTRWARVCWSAGCSPTPASSTLPSYPSRTRKSKQSKWVLNWGQIGAKRQLGSFSAHFCSFLVFEILGFKYLSYAFFINFLLNKRFDKFWNHYNRDQLSYQKVLNKSFIILPLSKIHRYNRNSSAHFCLISSGEWWGSERICRTEGIFPISRVSYKNILHKILAYCHFVKIR